MTLATPAAPRTRPRSGDVAQLALQRSYGDFCIASGENASQFAAWLPQLPDALETITVTGPGLAATIRGTGDFFSRHVDRDAATRITVVVLGTPLRRSDHRVVRPQDFLAAPLDARRGEDLWGQFMVVRIDAATGSVDWLMDLERSLSPWWTTAAAARIALRFAPQPSRTGATLDPTAAGEFLIHGVVGRERTPVHGWSLLPSAHWTRWERGRETGSAAYPHPIHETPERGGNVYQQLADEVGQVVEQATRGFGGALLPLTGGIDSRLLLAALLRRGVPFEAYTHGTPGCADQLVVEDYKRHVDIVHRFHPIAPPQFAEFRARVLGTLQPLGPDYDHLAYPHLLTSYAAEDPTERLFLSGVGTGLHKIPYLPQVAHEWSRRPIVDAVVQHYGRLDNLPLLQPGVAVGAVEQMRAAIAACVGECPPGTARVHRLQHYHLQERLGRWAGKGMQLQDLCGYDIAYPFLAPELMRWSRLLGYSRLHLGQKIIRAIEILQPRLLRVHNANGWPVAKFTPGALGRHLPAYWRGWSRYVHRKTHGHVAANIAIVDYREVYRNTYRDWMIELLDPQRSHLGEVVTGDALERLAGDLRASRASPRRLGPLAALELWCRS